MLFFKKKNEQPRNPAGLVAGAKKEQKVFSYYNSGHKQLNTAQRTNRISGSAEAARRHGQNIFRHWFGIVAAIILITSSGYIISLSLKPQIIIEGTAYRPMSEYQTIGESALKGNPLNYTKPTLPRVAIEKKIKEQIPETQKVIVSAPLLGHRPNITLVMDEPAAVMKQQDEQDLIVSQRGRLLLTANHSKYTANLPVITNQSGVIGKAGEQFLRPDDMRSLNSVIEQIKLSGSAAGYILPPQTREIIMVEPSRGVYQVRFLFGDTILQQYGALRATQKKLLELGEKPSEYVDARLANKIFYK